MCTVCGCGESTTVEPTAVEVHGSTAHLHYGAGAARVSVPGLSQARTIALEADVLGANKRFAAHNRAHFAAHGVTAVNLLSGPGAGKTTLLCATIAGLRTREPERPLAVIEGDQQTSLDADRIRAAGAPAVQVNTGQGCHLDAQMVGDAFERLALHAHGPHSRANAQALLLIENVGNLVCPALWDLGEAAKVVLLSVTEGDDKPLKYPDMFAAAQLVVLTKVDLLPYLDFDVVACADAVHRVNPGVEILQLSVKSGHGLDAWIDWLRRPRIATTHHAQPGELQGRGVDG